jgi:hypothetical protein
MATRVLACIVYRATPRNPLVLVATRIPAQRALSVNPVNLPRKE